jgi:pilus assembly protein CpaD
MHGHISRLFVASAALSLALLAAGCSSNSDLGNLQYDAAANHPIAVEPQTVTLSLPFSTKAKGLPPRDEVRLRRFATRYLSSGHGALSIVAPQNAEARRQLSFFGGKLAGLGVSLKRILVGTDGVVSSDHVELRFMTYEAKAPHCGDWNNISHTGSNLPMENFGCATQHNLAVMVADPRDLIAPRRLGTSDATERTQMMQKYETGKLTTSAQPPQAVARVGY